MKSREDGFTVSMPFFVAFVIFVVELIFLPSMARVSSSNDPVARRGQGLACRTVGSRGRVAGDGATSTQTATRTCRCSRRWVGRPLNPNRELAQIAKARRWPVRRFHSRGLPGVGDIVRTSLVYASKVPSLWLGAAAGLINGSRREGINVAAALWSDLATSLAGVDLRVEGEQHLWSHRPAVFIFNQLEVHRQDHRARPSGPAKGALAVDQGHLCLSASSSPVSRRPRYG